MLKSLNFSDLKSFKILTFSSSAPKYRYLCAGLTLEGICKREGCEAFNKNVLLPVGMGHFSIAEIIHFQKCPICAQEINHSTIKTMGFYYCYYQVTGKKTDEAKLFEIKKTQAPADGWVTFDSEEKDCTEWFFLKITTEPCWLKEMSFNLIHQLSAAERSIAISEAKNVCVFRAWPFEWFIEN